MFLRAKGNSFKIVDQARHSIGLLNSAEVFRARNTYSKLRYIGARCKHTESSPYRHSPFSGKLPYVRQGKSCFRECRACTSVSCDESRKDRIQRKLEAFRELLDDPDHGWINSKDARMQFGLTRDDLNELRTDVCLIKESAYCHENRNTLTQYKLADVVRLAKQKLGREVIIAHYHRYCLHGSNDDNRRIFQQSPKLRSKQYWYSAPSTDTVEGQESVRQGLISNSAICLVKGSVWVYTGSHAVFADLMHSCADVANYLYRILQLSRSMQKSDLSHPYGYAPLRYITADRSFVILGVLGCVAPLVHSVSELSCLSASASLAPEMLLAPAFVFLVSAALEGLAMRTAYHEILRQSKAAMSAEELASPTAEWRRCVAYIYDGRDVMSVATFCESASGVVGAFCGLSGLGLAWYLETVVVDIAASIVMASSVGAVSAFLLHRSGEALLGRTLPMPRVELIVEKLEERATIFAVYDVKTEVVGTDTVRFKAEVHFNSEAITECILRIGSAPKRLHLYETSSQQSADHQAIPARLRSQAVEMFPKLQEGLPTRSAAENWLHANNALFYEALAWELKMVEREIRNDLEDFKNVHIDLEPW